METHNLERVALSLASLGPLDIVSLRGTEALSTLFSYEASNLLPASQVAELNLTKLIGDQARIVLRDVQGGSRTITGIVAEAEVVPRDTGEAVLSVVVRPLLYRLSLGQDARAFHDLDVVGIAESVLQAAGVPARFEVTERYPKRAYTAQYQESDFCFLSRLFEEDGLYYWFDHASGSTLVVSDRSASAPDLDAESWQAAGRLLTSDIVHRDASGLNAAADHVIELGDAPKLVPSKFSLGSFDPAKPSFKVAGSAGSGALEVYDAPGAGHEDPAVLDARARKRGEGARAGASIRWGKTTSVRFAPGRTFNLTGHAFSRFDGGHIITAVELSVDAIGFQRGDASKPIEVRFAALPSDVPYRPPQITPRPRHAGLQSGIVTGPPGDEVYPDRSGRVRVQHHWDRTGTRDDRAGRWIRVSQRGTAGSMLLPRVGWNVLSVAEEGSVDLPVALSRTFDAEHPPPYPLPANKTRLVFKTATTPGGGTYNELRYEDKKGQEEIFINATRDLNVLVKDRKTELVHTDMTRTVGRDHKLEVGGSYEVHVKGTQAVSVGGNQTEKVTANRTKLVERDEQITIGATRKEMTGQNLEITVDSRSVQVGAAQIDVTLGAVNATSKIVSTMVGGAVVKVTPRKMSEAVGSTVNADTVIGYLPESAKGRLEKLKKIPGASKLLSKIPSKAAGAAFQTIGLTKIELGEERKITVDKSYSEKIMGTLSLLTRALSDTAAKSFELIADALHIESKKVTFESDKEVVVQCDATMLTVSAENGIKLTAPEIQLDGAAVLVASAGKVEQN